MMTLMNARPFMARRPRTAANRPATARACTLLVVSALYVTLLPQVVEAVPPAIEAPTSASEVGAGSVGPRVKEIQQALIKHGVYLPGGADGVWGRATTKGLADFQTWNGLTRTGALNTATLRRLGLTDSTSASGSNATQPATQPPTTSTPSATESSAYSKLALGSKGPAVAQVQRALMATGLVIRGGADGVFGPATARALKAFQRVNGLNETGAMSTAAARLLKLTSNSQSTATSQSAAATPRNGTVNLERFPVQGHCGFGDTWHQSRGNGRVHEGVDIIAPTGNLLYAVDDGVITTQYWDYPGRRSGNGLKLTAADGTYYVYLHLSAFAPGIAKGSRVEAGDVIGFVGSTGSSATPHLHFEIHPGGGAPVNPYPYVKAINDCSNTKARY